MTVAVSVGSALKKIPDEMAERMSQMGGGAGTNRTRRRPSEWHTSGSGQPPDKGRHRAGRGRGGIGSGARGGIDDMFERFDTISATI